MIEQVLERIAAALEKIADKEVTRIAKADTFTPDGKVSTATQPEPVQQPQAQTATQPEPVTAPPVQEPQSIMYTSSQLGLMCRQLADQGKLPAIQQMFQSFGITALDQLPQDKYGDFANQLILQGAKL